MDKPKPSAEVITRVTNNHLIVITAHSDDAHAWIRQHAPEFGDLYPEGRRLHLYVSDGYDANEVAEYLSKMQSDKE